MGGRSVCDVAPVRKLYALWRYGVCSTDFTSAEGFTFLKLFDSVSNPRPLGRHTQ